MSNSTLTPRKARSLDAAAESLLDLRHERDELRDRIDDEILAAYRAGLTFAEIAYSLGISQPTARRYYRRRLTRGAQEVTA